VHAHGDKSQDISYADALNFAEAAAKKNHWLGHFAMGYLARFVPYGPDSGKVRMHYLKAFQDPDGMMIRDASRNDPIAAYALAEIFTSDEVRPTVIPDLKMAAEYYEIASQKGYGPASVQLALFKLHSIADPGLGIAKDLKGGIGLLQQSAKRNLPAAHHYLGRCYFKGIGVEADNDMALVHFQAAADRGKSLSQLLVADFYAYGVSGPVKLDLALRYARLASVQEQEQAMLKINEYENLKQVDPSPKKDMTTPSNEFSQTSNVVPMVPSLPAPDLPPPPPPPGSERLPSVYEPSVQTPTEPESVTPPIVLDEPRPAPVVEAASNGTDLRNSAKNAYWGKGQSVNLQVAYSLFLDAANTGDAESARYLGMMFMQGKGVNQDSSQALYWFDLAAQRGDKLAKSNLEKLKGVLGRR
jgi:TPR repeat protein